MDRLVRECNPERFVPIGSYAYDRPREDSDVDQPMVMYSKRQSSG